MKTIYLPTFVLFSIIFCMTVFTIPASSTHANVHHRFARQGLQTTSHLHHKLTDRPESPKQHVRLCYGSDCDTPTSIFGESSCLEMNGTSYMEASTGNTYVIICDVDFPGQDIYPFILAKSFEGCLKHCEDYNQNTQLNACAGFVYAPERISGDDNCYLKISLENPFEAKIRLVGAILLPSSDLDDHTGGFNGPSIISSGSSDEPCDFHVEAKLLGTSVNVPTKQYIWHPMAFPQKLATEVLTPGINTDLITEYPLAGDTGIWTEHSVPLEPRIEQMVINPRLSRDGGKGGTINGTRVFIFCDTANFVPGIDGGPAEMVGFVSSSVATDIDMNALSESSLNLVDHLGEWQDDVGRMRGFAPMTTGEQAFNIALAGDGFRYAVWPESSLITLNSTHALLYAALVYDEVDMNTQSANFTTLGNTLLLVSVDPVFGPSAQRLVTQLFRQGEVAFGTLGGIREWSVSGPGHNDGQIYLFGQVDRGVAVARVSPKELTDLSKYYYFNGTLWVTNQRILSDTALILQTPVMDFDMIYVPILKTFIMVYLNTLADNTFYFRYLVTNITDPTTKKTTTYPIIPAYEKGGAINYIETILPYPGNPYQWSAEIVAYKVVKPAVGYVYAGGVHQGYFGAEDITQGGRKMLISWTEHTGKDAGSEEGGYAHKTALIVLRRP